MKRILVLNPNSSIAVTAQMREGCRELSLYPGHTTQFDTLSGAPEGIESQRDVESVVISTCNYFLAHPADAYVIGCFSDPGLFLAREEIAVPVLGIAESALLLAASLRPRFGIVSIKQGSIARHLRAVRALQLSDRLAGDRALNLSVAQLLDEQLSVGRILEIGRQLRDQDGAEALVLGCATMGSYRARIESALKLPIIDPTQAAIVRASALLTMGYGKIA